MASLKGLGATGRLILETFAAELAPLITVPERQVLAAGNVAVWDGEQLVVNLQGIGQGQPGAPFAQTYTPTAINLVARFGLQIVRDVPVQMEGPVSELAPSAEELSESGETALDDASALTQAAVAIHQAHKITGPGEGFVIEDVSPLGPEGGMAAVGLTLILSLT